MPVIEESIVIDRPRDEVFAFMNDPDNVPVWNSNVIEYERITEGPLKQGTQNRVKAKVVGKTLEATNEVTEFEEGRRVVSRTIDSPLAVEGETRFEETSGGTRVTFHQEAEIPGGFFGRLAEPLVARMFAKDVRANLEKLKELLEAQ